MTRIELGSPSISQKKHLIGYWVSDDENVKLDAVKIGNNTLGEFYICQWVEVGTYYGRFLAVQIMENKDSKEITYDLTTATETDETAYSWVDKMSSDVELNELDLIVKLEDGEHALKLHKTH